MRLRPRISMNVHGGFRHSFLAYGPPGAGKTNWESLVALPFPGAAFISSTRADIARDTAAARARRGPVWFLNPRFDGGFPSNLEWSPLAGCRDYRVAMESAGALIHAGPRNEDGASNWIDAESKRFLQYLMHAAGLAGDADICTVRLWGHNPADARAPVKILGAAGNPAWARALDDMSARAAADPLFAEGVAGGIGTALAWLDDLELAYLACPPPGEEFDIRQFIRDQGTVYVIAADSPNCSVSPYVACFATAVRNTAEEMAADPAEPAACGLRLDPPLLMLIDEPDAGCPVPVGDWARTAGGNGVTLVTGYQSDAQPRRRDGDHGGQVLEDCFTVKLVFRGGTGPIYGKASEWGGKHDTWDWVKNTDGSRTRQPRQTVTFPPERIGNLKEGEAFVKVNGVRGFIAKIGLVKDHPLYEKADPADFTDAPELVFADDAIAWVLLYLALLRAARTPLPVPRRAIEAPSALALTRGEVPSWPDVPASR